MSDAVDQLLRFGPPIVLIVTAAWLALADRDGGFAGTLDMHEDMKVRRQKVERLLAAEA